MTRVQGALSVSGVVGRSFFRVSFQEHTITVELRSPEKPVVLVVWADPEPYDVALIQHAESAIVDADAH